MYMMKFQLPHLLHCLVLMTAIAFNGCGYVSDKPPANLDVFKTDELQGCKIDIDKLGEIFKADQKEQIRCLQENFIQFTKYVRSRDSGAISETELNAFVKKFFQAQSDSIVKGLSLIFQLNMLLLRDEATKISRTNISPLFELLVKVNQEAVIITQVLKEMDDKKNQGHFWELRAKFNASITRFSEGTIEIIKKSPGLQQKLNIKDFIIEAAKKLGSKEINPETIDSLIFLKKVLVGGEKEIITSDELRLIIAKLPKIMAHSFDLYYVEKTNFSSDADHARFYLTNIRDVYSIIQFNQSNFQLFTIDQILHLAENFAPEELVKDKDMKKFKSSIVAIKSRLIGGDKESFSLRDLKVILDISTDLAERAYFNVVTYGAHRDDLEQDRSISHLKQLDPKEYDDLFSFRRVTELHQDFQETAVNIRYFRSEKEGIPYYGNEIKRNKYGFLEATSIRWASQKLLIGYGHKNAKGELQVSLLEFQTFLDDMKPILEELNLWSPNPKTFAQNAILLADLFQNQSNGDLEVNLTEATEYIQMILSSVEISDKFRIKLSSVCDTGINHEDPIYETTCFNNYFFNALLDQLNFKKFFPRLDLYVKNTPQGEVDEFLGGVEGFARDNPNPNEPINKRDNILILGALINIESTFIRFDTNKDNIIDYKELTEAFKVYKLSIITLAELKGDKEKFALSIFLYMASKMEVPKTKTLLQNANFLAFHSCHSVELCRKTFMDKIEAKRLNVGKLLYYMVNQNTIAVSRGK